MSDFIQTTLAKSPNLYEETLSLLETAFEYPSHHSFQIDFNPLIGPNNHEHCHLLLDKQKVIAHIGIRKRKIVYKDKELSVVLFGGIAVDKSYRGQGVFSNFFNEILDLYKDSGSLFFLWSDLTHLYNKFNFYEAGGIIQTGRKTLLKESLKNNWSETSFDQISLEQLEQIKTLYKESTTLKLDRDERYWSSIREITSARLFIKEEDSKILSYFILGKGRDLEGIIHEYRTNNEEDFLKEIDSFKLWLPEKYNKVYHKKEIHYGFFLKLNNIPELSNFLKEITDSKLQIKGSDKVNIYFTFNNNEYELTHKDFINSLFGPNPIKEFEDIFPGLMINGLDSI